MRKGAILWGYNMYAIFVDMHIISFLLRKKLHSIFDEDV
jgi:hypothetical protein